MTCKLIAKDELGERVLPAQGTECAKDMKQEQALCVKGIQRRSVSLELRKEGVEEHRIKLQSQGGATQPGPKAH